MGKFQDLARWVKQLVIDTVAVSVLGWVASLPGAVALTAVAVAWLSDLPIGWIIPAGALAYAGIVTGLLRHTEYRYQQDPENKLAFVEAGIGFSFVRDAETGAPQAIKYAQLKFTLQNKAKFSLSCITEELTSNCEGRINPNPAPVADNIVGPAHLFLVGHQRIDMGETPIKDQMEARVKFRMRYGKPGKEKFYINRHINLVLNFSQDRAKYKTIVHDILE